MTDNKKSKKSKATRHEVAVSVQAPVPTSLQRPRVVTERDLLHKHHRLLRHNDDDNIEPGDSCTVEETGQRRSDRVERADEYGKEIARAYYKKLVKDFPLLDLSRYKEGMVALRWRTMAEFCKNKGGPQGVCGEISCEVQDEDYTPNAENDCDYDSTQSRCHLEKRQVLFNYLEDSADGTRQEQKSIMVSCWLCPRHGRRLDKSHEYEKALRDAVSSRSSESKERRNGRQCRRHGQHPYVY
ncbi:folate-sensitive fragile site protein Fra10Ac1-domain-containing protein [Lipomyces chichibuensis]|uniref:folate-sensitive fragile site protein Fra10Ac1-domain-containing protein n=1 Tax=Lipomyces chichibuensis TaxID=1546026 RepID=UPI003343FE55